jgi:hypothetical protein
MNELWIFFHGLMAAALGWMLKVLYAIHGRVSRIEQWMIDKQKGGPP